MTAEEPQSGVPKRISYVSLPALVTGIVLTAILMAGALAVWWALGPEIRAQVSWIQAATLLFFVVFMMGVMLMIGYSHLWAENGKIVIRNGPVLRKIDVEDVAGLRLRKGDAWAYLLVKDPERPGSVQRRAVLAIQSLEGKRAEKKVRELRNWLKANGASSEGVIRE
ncbi:MAG: hypothetical protein GX596_12040 [Propionibacterium sp.]|nr:hypothetical protein [Propionibacterium sp.]